MRKARPEGQVDGNAQFLKNRRKMAEMSEEKRRSAELGLTVLRSRGRPFNLDHLLEDVAFLSRPDVDVEKLAAEGIERNVEFFLEELQGKAIDANKTKSRKPRTRRPDPKGSKEGEEE